MRRFFAFAACLALCAGLCAPALALSFDGGAVGMVQILEIMNGDENGDLRLDDHVTRAEFARMMTSASVYKESVSGGSNVSPFPDVRRDHWAAGYIRNAVTLGWLNGYTDGTFRPEDNIKLEEAANAVLKMLGYTGSDFTGAFPDAQLEKYRSLELDTDISAQRGDFMTRLDCANLFYNLLSAEAKDGTVYAEKLGYSVDALGELNYASIIEAKLKGPFVSWDGSFELPFAEEEATVYKNGSLSSADELSKYDVYYYNERIKTVWAYRNMVTGVYSAAAPATATPTSVTVAGNSYAVGTSAASYSLSEMGEYAIGDNITLLLGMHGEVVAVVPAITMNEVVYGVVTGASIQTFTDKLGESYDAQVVDVVSTSGESWQYIFRNTYLKLGQVVRADMVDGELVVDRYVNANKISGTVDSRGEALGDRDFAEDIEIIDANDNGAWKVIYPERLAGMELESDDIKAYVRNPQGEITKLILNNATGDLKSYGIIHSVSETRIESIDGSSSTASGTYSFQSGAVVQTLGTDKHYGVSVGPAVVDFEGDKVTEMENLAAVKLTGTGSTSVSADGRDFELPEDVQVYIKLDDEYVRSNLSSVSDLTRYTLMGYHDGELNSGGRIRIIVAERIEEE